MDICKNLNSIKHFEKSVLTIGSFDGMHCGHLEIIRDLQMIAALAPWRLASMAARRPAPPAPMMMTSNSCD